MFVKQCVINYNLHVISEGFLSGLIISVVLKGILTEATSAMQITVLDLCLLL